jgi:hypothetical protein
VHERSVRADVAGHEDGSPACAQGARVDRDVTMVVWLDTRMMKFQRLDIGHPSERGASVGESFDALDPQRTIIGTARGAVDGRSRIRGAQSNLVRAPRDRH